jgi:hypothetical protein
MSTKRIEIFKKASNSLKISLKCYEILKKKPYILKKKASRQLPYCHNGQSAPAVECILNTVFTYIFFKKKEGYGKVMRVFLE